MRVRLVVDCESPNPDFDPELPADEENPINIVLEAGHEIEDPMAWMLCFPEYKGTVCRAEPVDDIAIRKVKFERTRMDRLRAARKVAGAAVLDETKAEVEAIEQGDPPQAEPAPDTTAAA